MLQNPAQKNYKILKEEDMKRLQEDEISDVVNVLSVSRSVACTLLCQHKWSRSSVYESWFDENRNNAETQFAVTSTSPEKEECRLCCRSTEEEALLLLLSGACGHLFCVRCWRNDILRSIVDHNTNINWCPNASCDLAIEFREPGEGDSVKCDCGYVSCWSCGLEGHGPLDCGSAAKWVRDGKKKNEADSAAWLLANTKPCPKCKRPIQNEGPIHVICRDPCWYEFCWRCLLPCGYESCSSAEEEEERVRKKARIDPLEGYERCYERFEYNEISQKRASARVRPNELWERIVEWRRVLKWSYAFGYYLSERGSARSSLFDYLLKRAESSLERLQRCAENEMVDRNGKGFKEFFSKLTGLIRVTEMEFEVLAKHTDELKE